VSGRSSLVVEPVAAAALAVLLLGACSGSGDNLASPSNAAATVVATPADGSSDSGGTATASTVADPSAPGSSGSSPDSSADSTVAAPIATPVSIVDVPEVGVPGLDSTDVFCASWSRFAGSFQVVAVTAAFGSGAPQQLAALEVAAAPTVTAAYADLLANWPPALATEHDAVAEDYLGPFERRLAEAFESLAEVGADDATIDAIGDAWLAGLAGRDPSTPEFVVDLPDGIWETIDEAATLFGTRLVPFGSDPSLVTDVSTPLTNAYIGASCPDQGTLSGREVAMP
jgi:hypothetical protein